ILIYTNVQIGQITFAYHSLILTSALTGVGAQSIFFWILAQKIATQKGLLLPEPLFNRLQSMLSLERCVTLGFGLIMAGLGLAFYALFSWYELSFGEIVGERLIKFVCGASLLTVVGFEIIFASFLLSLLDYPPKRYEETLDQSIDIAEQPNR